MIPSRFRRPYLLVLFLSMIAAAVFPQRGISGEFEPRVGQDGKDVIWVPTSQALVDKMLDVAKVTAQDYVIDLGSGDGRTVITAAKRGARALGVEFNPDMVALSKRNAVREGVASRAQFVEGDLYQADLSQATVLTMFLLEEINLKLRPKILNLKPGTRIVSNSFTMGEWKPDDTVAVENREECTAHCTAYLWIVPAKVEGRWSLPQGELTLEQSFQTLSGTLKSGADSVPITDGKLRGDLISFRVGTVDYTGRVNASTIQGTFESGGSAAEWKAAKIGRLLPAPPKKRSND